MDKQNLVIHSLKYDLIIKSKKLLICATTGVNLKNIVLSQLSQMQKITYCMIPLI